MATLQGRAIKDTYKDLLQVSTNNNTGVTSTMSTVEDGEGTSSALEISTTGVKVDGTLEVTGDVTGVPHVDYKGNYSGSTAYVKDDVVFFNGSSYIAKQSSTGNSPTNTTYWGLLAQKGTDGVTPPTPSDGVDGDGWTGGSYDASTGVVTFTSNDGLGFSTGDLRGADGSSGVGGTNSSLTETANGTIEIDNGNDNVASLVVKKTGTGDGTAAIFVETEATADGQLAALELRGGVNLMAWRDTAPTTSSNTGQALQTDAASGNTLRQEEEDFRNFNLVNSNGKFGLDSVNADNTQYSSMFEFYPVKNVDGVDGSGGHYAWSNGLAHWAQFNLNGGISMGKIDTSDAKNQFLLTNDANGFWVDLGNSWNFRGFENNSYHRMYLVNEGNTGTIGTNGSGGTSSEAWAVVDGVNAEAEVKRNVGTYNGTNYGVTSDYPSTNVDAHYCSMQVQSSVGRLSFTYQAHLEDPNKWRNTSSASSFLTTTGGQASGNIGGFYIYGEGLESSSNKRALAPNGDNMDLGNSANEWRNMFIQTTPVGSSDRNLKQDIEELTEAEKRVATALKGLVKKYRWKDAVAKKGEDARIHIGFIAQEVEEAFTAEGLNGFDYAILCKDQHYKVLVNGVDTKTVQRTNSVVEDDIVRESLQESDEVTFEPYEKYALRYEQLHSFIISAL